MIQLHNAPLALHPSHLAALLAGQAEAALSTVALNDLAGWTDRDGNPIRGFTVQDGVAVIGVKGVLVQRLGMPWALECGSWGLTGYDGIAHNLGLALAAPDVRGIALHINSPGGDVAGCFDLVDSIYAMRGGKPIWAILDEKAQSGGYAIASAADRITIPRTGNVGSIGVVCQHMDVSDAFEQAGIKPTLIQYGARKTERWGLTPLSDSARASLQAEVDESGELFTATVARNRGLDPEAVRGFEAGCFQGANGVAVGLADEVMSAQAAFAALLASLA